MAVNDVAQAAYNVMPMSEIVHTPYGDFPLPTFMVSIAGAEDDFTNAPGDPGILNTCNPPGTLVNGYGSYGAWQMSLSCDAQYIQQASGLTDPAAQAAWLTDYTNCAKAAYLAYQARGPANWCTWWSDALCGTRGGQPGYGPYHQYLDKAQQAIAALVGSVTTPTPSPSFPSWLPWLGGGVMLAGLGLGLWWWNDRRQPVMGFARRRDETHMDARVDPKWLTYINPTAKDVAEVAKPLSGCDIYANLKAASERRGVPVLEDRNLPEGTEAVYVPPKPELPQFPKGRIMLGVPVTRQAEKCMPYGVQTVLHEDGHSVLHHPGCLPQFRGVTYSSENHQVEEQEVELGSFAAMVELGLPVETYEGVVYPAGTEEIDWAMAKRNLDPQTYENVRWLADVLVRAGQGDVDALANATCPLARKGA